MKRVVLLTVFVVFMAACAAEGADPTTAPSATTTPSEEGPNATAASDTSDPQPAATDAGSTKPDIPADAPDAPDFVFTLGDGTDYHLGSDAKPVYLIFWAEW
jgi:hypothetical protein